MASGDYAWIVVTATVAIGVFASCDDDGSRTAGIAAGTAGSGGSSGAGPDSSAGTNGGGTTADSGEPHDAGADTSVLGDASHDDSNTARDGDTDGGDAALTVCGSGRTFDKMTAGRPRVLASQLYTPDQLLFAGNALLFSSTLNTLFPCITPSPFGCPSRSTTEVNRVEIATGGVSLVAAGGPTVDFDVEGDDTFVVTVLMDHLTQPRRARAARYGVNGAASVQGEWEGLTAAIRSVGGFVFYYRSDYRCYEWSGPVPVPVCIRSEIRRYLVETSIDRFGDPTALRRLADGFSVLDLVSDGREVVFAAEGAVRSVSAGTGVPYDADAGVDAAPGPPPSRELLSGLKGGIQLALDSDAIYVASPGLPNDAGAGTGRLVRIARNDGSVLDLVSGGAPRSLAIDAQHVYFVDGPFECGFVARVPKRGGPIELVAVDQPRVSSVAASTDLVAWTHKLSGKSLLSDGGETDPRGAILVADK